MPASEIQPIDESELYMYVSWCMTIWRMRMHKESSRVRVGVTILDVV